MSLQFSVYTEVLNLFCIMWN